MGNSTIHIACELLQDVEIVKMLVEGGADVNSVNSENLTALEILQKREPRQQ